LNRKKNKSIQFGDRKENHNGLQRLEKYGIPVNGIRK
jgi:hypothetical protein